MGLAAIVRENPQTVIQINLETGLVTYDDVSLEFGMPDSIREAFLTGTWDTLPLLQRNQAKVAEAKGLKLIFAEIEVKAKKLKLDAYFDDRTMSVHLRENVEAAAKKGPSSTSLRMENPIGTDVKPNGLPERINRIPGTA